MKSLTLGATPKRRLGVGRRLSESYHEVKLSRKNQVGSGYNSSVRVATVRGKKVRDSTIAGQPAHRHVRSVENPAGFDPRAVDSVKFPDERQYFGEVADSVELATPEHAG